MSTAVATLEPRRSLIADMAARYNMDPKAFADTLRGTVVPKNATNEEFAAFLLVAKEYNLNPITREIFAFPKQGGGIQPIVSVDGWANLVNSHPQCDGFEFDDVLDEKGNVVSITCRIYRKDRSRHITATEYMSECKRDTSTWKQWPRRMLRHKALIQAARYAFGFAGIVDPDEAERADHYTGSPGARLVPPPAPAFTPPSPPAPVNEAEAALPGDWTDYLAKMKDELVLAQTSEVAQQVHDTVSDAINGANERGEISASDVEVITHDWEVMTANV